MVTSANALNEPTHAHNKFNTQRAAQHSLPSHGLFIELLLFVRCGVVNPSEMTVNIHRDLMKGDVTSALKMTDLSDMIWERHQQEPDASNSNTAQQLRE